MKITPLVIHAGLQLPRWTSLFSDALAVSQIGVVSGGTSTFTVPAGHGVQIGRYITLCVADAKVPNGITAASVNASGDVVLTTAFEHNLNASPDPTRFRAWSREVLIAGFASALINGIREIVATPDRNTVIIKPGGAPGAITLSGAELIREPLELALTGWHKALAATSTTLTIPTPATVTRSYTILSPVVTTGIRVYGAIDGERAVRQLTIGGDNLVIDKGHLFIMPRQVKASRGGRGLADISPGADYRMHISDGFTCLAFLPSTGAAAHIRAVDKAQGEIFKAILRSFHGLRVQRSEICAPGNYLASFESHRGGMHANNAVYAHEYEFDAPFMLANDDALAPWDWTVLDDIALDQGTVPSTIYPVGTVPMSEIEITGIFHAGHPSGLSGTFEVDGA